MTLPTTSQQQPSILSSEEVSNLLASGSVSPQEDIDRLRASAELLDDQIKALVLDNRELLLAETTSVGDAAKDFQKLFLAVRSLQSVASRVKSEVSEPRSQLSAKTRELAVMYETVDLLRQTTHHIRLVARIKAELGTADARDLSKVARLLTEASQAWAEGDLSGIRICEENHRYVESTTADVRGQAMELLERGVESRNQVDTGFALQALQALQELGQSLDLLTQEMVQRVKKRFMRSLDAKRLAGGGGLGIGSIGGLGASQQHANDIKVWEELEKSMDELRESAVQAWYLENVLSRKKLSGHDHGRPFEMFWTMAVERIKECFEAAMVARSRTIRDALVGNYQRLAGLLEDTLASIARETIAGRSSSITDEYANAYYGMVASVESEYLNAIQGRLESLALAAFPGGARAPLPSQVDLQGLHARFFEEMKRSQRGGERVVTLTAAVLGTVLLTIASLARDMGDVTLTVSASDVNANGSGERVERNVFLAKSLEDLARHAGSLSHTSSVSARVAWALDGPVNVLRQTVRELLEPIFRSKTDQTKNIIKKMHAVNFAAAHGAESEVASPSAYIVELNAAMGAFGRDVLRRLQNPAPAASNSSNSSNSSSSSAVTPLAAAMGSSLSQSWIKHASLIRPLTGPGKLQLAKDAAELELAIRQLSSSGSMTPRTAVEQLHVFKKLLFAEDVSVIESMAVRARERGGETAAPGTLLARSTVLHHLFSRLPESIASPHAHNKLTPAQYVVWMEDHTEEEVVKLIRSALDLAGAVATGRPESSVLALMNQLAARFD